MGRAIHKSRRGKPAISVQTFVSTTAGGVNTVSLDVGPQHSGKTIIIAIPAEDNGGVNINGVDVGGLTMTNIGAQLISENIRMSIWAVRAPMLSGSKTITITPTSGSLNTFAVFLLSLLNVIDPFTPTFNASDIGEKLTYSAASVDAEHGGITLACASINITPSRSWSGLTERQHYSAGTSFSLAYDLYLAAPRSAATVSITWGSVPNAGGVFRALSLR